MTIEYINKKTINYKNIQHLLSISEKENQYTNNGPVKKLLERKIESMLNLKNKKIICLSNGTTAIHAAMMLYGVKKWAIPSFTFPSALVGNKYKVDVLDIDKKTFSIPISNKLKKYGGIIITNPFGSFVNIEEYVYFCNKNGIKLIFDNAASIMSKYNGISLFEFGNCSIGSFHHTKYMGFGEGGFISCNEENYNKLTAISNFGFFGSREYSINSSNFKISDISSAFILDYINNFDINKYITIQNKLINDISKIKNVDVFNYKEGTVYNSLPILFNRPTYENEFDKITVHKYYQPLKNKKNSLYLYERIINLPLHIDLSNDELERIINVVKIIAEKNE